MTLSIFLSNYGNAWLIDADDEYKNVSEFARSHREKGSDLSKTLYLHFRYETNQIPNKLQNSFNKFFQEIDYSIIKDNLYGIKTNEILILIENFLIQSNEYLFEMSGNLIDLIDKNLIENIELNLNNLKIEKIEKKANSFQKAALQLSENNFYENIFHEISELVNWFYFYDRKNNRIMNFLSDVEKNKKIELDRLYQIISNKLDSVSLSSSYNILTTTLVSFGFESKKGLFLLGLLRIATKSSDHLNWKEWADFDIYFRISLENNWTIGEFLSFGQSNYFNDDISSEIYLHHKIIPGGIVRYVSEPESASENLMLMSGEKIHVKNIKKPSRTIEQMKYFIPPNMFS